MSCWRAALVWRALSVACVVCAAVVCESSCHCNHCGCTWVCAVQPRLWCKADRGCGSLAASSPPAGMCVVAMSLLLPAAGSMFAVLVIVIVLPTYEFWLTPAGAPCMCTSMLLVVSCASPVAFHHVKPLLCHTSDATLECQTAGRLLESHSCLCAMQ